MVGRRRGRQRRVVKREPNGQAQRKHLTKAETKEQVAASMPHRRGIRAEDKTDAMAESLLGRLTLAGKIERWHYAAGVCWRDLVHRYARVIDAPMHSPRSPSGALVGPSAGGRDMDEAEAQRVRAAYNNAYCYLQANAGNSAAIAVSHCAVHDRGVDMQKLLLGLNALVEHFRLTPRANKPTVRNIQSQTAS